MAQLVDTVRDRLEIVRSSYASSVPFVCPTRRARPWRVFRLARLGNDGGAGPADRVGRRLHRRAGGPGPRHVQRQLRRVPHPRRHGRRPARGHPVLGGLLAEDGLRPRHLRAHEHAERSRGVAVAVHLQRSRGADPEIERAAGGEHRTEPRNGGPPAHRAQGRLDGPARQRTRAGRRAAWPAAGATGC